LQFSRKRANISVTHSSTNDTPDRYMFRLLRNKHQEIHTEYVYFENVNY